MMTRKKEQSLFFHCWGTNHLAERWQMVAVFLDDEGKEIRLTRELCEAMKNPSPDVKRILRAWDWHKERAWQRFLNRRR